MVVARERGEMGVNGEREMVEERERVVREEEWAMHDEWRRAVEEAPAGVANRSLRGAGEERVEWVRVAMNGRRRERHK